MDRTEALRYARACIAGVYEQCKERQLSPQGGHTRVVDRCLENIQNDSPGLLDVTTLLGWKVNFYNRFTYSIPSGPDLSPSVRSGYEAGKEIGSNLCDPTDPHKTPAQEVYRGVLDFGGSSSSEGAGGSTEGRSGTSAWAWRIGAGAAASGAAWYFLSRPNGGSGTGSGSGNNVVELRPRRKPFQISDIDQKAARVAVDGGILAVLGVIAARLLIFTPQGAAASVMMLPEQHSSEVY